MNILILVPLIVALVTTGCSFKEANAGHEVVLIEKPWIFGHGGVDPEPVRAGMSITAVTTDGVDVSMQPMKFETELPDTMTADGVPITFHAIMVVQVTDSVMLIKNFGPTGTRTTWKSSSRRWSGRRSASGV